MAKTEHSAETNFWDTQAPVLTGAGPRPETYPVLDSEHAARGYRTTACC